MPRTPLLPEFELMVLLAVLQLGDEAYGVSLARELTEIQGRTVAIGSVYTALERLEGKGAVSSVLGESTPERGGRAKRYFRVTPRGLRAAHATREVMERLWQALPARGAGPA